MKSLLVTGTDTGVGKTWVTCALVRQFCQLGIRTGAYKPVCSGVEIDPSGCDFWGDVESLRAACGTSPAIDLVCPQRFRAAVAPNVAAAKENRTVDDALLLRGIEEWRPFAELLLIEGAGGIFCPLSNESTMMDFAFSVKSPVIVVAANRLGVINHTRLTVEAIQAKGLTVAAIVLNEVMPSENSDADPSLSTNALQLQRWIPAVPLFHCGWNATCVVSPGANHDIVQILQTA